MVQITILQQPNHLEVAFFVVILHSYVRVPEIIAQGLARLALQPLQASFQQVVAAFHAPKLPGRSGIEGGDGYEWLIVINNGWK